ncbi:hypothetical protein [Clostridium sp.]|uniref:hypothetical protein n=1 Tax=Clostridium sp. TaxID=1506 RepID=UPI003217AAA4
MKKRKTKGSSMILVIAIFGILSTLGVVMLGTTYANYKLRIEENDRVKNLYSAESGIDQAYIKMSKVVEDGISEGIEAVNSKISQESNKNITIKDQNEVFKAAYTEYIVDSLGSIVANKVTGRYGVTDNEAVVTCKLKDKLADGDNNSDETLTNSVGDKIAKLTSSYTDINGKERIVSVSYTLTVPDDYKIIDKTDGKVSNILNYSIATDENLIIKNNYGNKTSMIVEGNVWVQGTRSDKIAMNPTVDKYKGGIEIINTNVDFIGQVNTSSNISVDGGSVSFENKDSNRQQIDTNVFAENIFLGNLENADETSEIELNGDNANVYLANDLVISSSDAKVNINNLYGFNDINVKSNIENEKEVRESSSIIINSMNWPNNKGNLTLKGSAYIMGAAYIKTNTTPYQTGESVALKGNYKAYTQPVIDKDGNILYDKYQYEYLNPLVLVTKNEKGEKLTIEEKANYFKEYSNSKDIQLRTEGISLPVNNTYTAGAYISNDSINKPMATVEKQNGDIFKFKGDFVKSVYYMNSDDYKEETLTEDFLYGSPKNTVASEVNWNGVDILIAEHGNIIDLGDIKVILNNEDERTVEVDEKNITILDKDKKPIADGKISYDSNYKYVIVTKGVVNYKSSAGYNGTIISLKDINLNNQSGTVGLINKLTPDEISRKENKGVLDFIFVRGENLITERVITAADIISKEKWTLEK